MLKLFGAKNPEISSAQHPARVASSRASESERLYPRLQTTVDEQMLQTGFVPPGNYGMAPPADSNPHAQPANVTQVANWQRGPAWKCSDKQKDLILKLVEEHQLDKADVEALANERFGKGVRTLNKVEASGLIDQLIDTFGGAKHKGNSTRRKQRVVALLETAVKGIASNRNPGCSVRGASSRTSAWPGCRG